MAAHESPRTTKLYDRTQERLTQDEVERIRLWPCVIRAPPKGSAAAWNVPDPPVEDTFPDAIGPLVEAKIFTQ